MDVKFDASWDAAFRQSPFSLRFELGGEAFSNADAPVPRFVQALTRARAIRDALFSESSQIIAVAACSPETVVDFFAPCDDGFAALSALGLRSSAIQEWKAPLDPHDMEDGDLDFIWRSFDVTSDTASQDALLWCSITYEMPISPKAPVISFLGDFTKGLLLHVYDDRGMDVTALEAAARLSIYEAFDPWLLDYDRDRMKSAFRAA